MKSLSKLSLAAVAVMAFIPVASLAQATRYPGYLVDGSGSIVKSGYGLCWHTGEWTPALAVEPCDPVIQRVVSAPPAPEPKAVVIAAVPLAPPPPPPVPVPMPKKISFSADALFAFDKAILKPEGKVMLDDLVRQLNDVTAYDKIILTGHADRFGSAAYNQKLSERRANAVKDYMVSKNIPATRIEASGLGKTQPETKPGDCPGAQSAKVIACLQPDRRVDVEMTGTKTVGCWVSFPPSPWGDKALQLWATGLVWAMALALSPDCVAQGEEFTVPVTPPVTVPLAAPVATPVAEGAWRIEFSPYTHHFRFNEDHKDVFALGLERETADHALFGLMLFSNSFGQPSAYAYYGRTFSPVERWSESLYVKLTGGLLYGYLPPYNDRVPLNYNGYSPAIIPAIGWRLDKNLSAQLNFLGTAAVMLMVNKKF